MPFVSIVLSIAMLVLNLFQLAAAQAGLHKWLGLPGWLAFAIGFLALLVGGPVVGLAVSVVGFFAAMQIWHWEWWQAALLCFPTVVLGIVLLILQGAAAGVGSLLSGRRKEY